MDILTVIGILVLFIVVFAIRGIKIIQQAETMVIERVGSYHRTLTSGLNVIWPIVDRARSIEWKYQKTDVSGKSIVRKETITLIDLRETVYDFPRQNVITRDNVAIEINALLYFQITDPKRAVYEIANLPDAIEKLTQTTLRNIIGDLDLDHTLTSRDTINSKLRAILDEATDKWGVKVNRVEIQDIVPPDDIKVAMEKQMRAERDKRAMILEAEGHKQAKILEAEGTRQSQINQADGSRQSQVLIATGEAEARIKIAEAEAEAVTRVTKAIKDSGGDPTSYLIALKYIDALKEMVSGKDNKVVYLPYEASALLGSISSIKDIFDGRKS
ncbi:MAG: SPFH/Band 7/PHB domain protein [Chlorobiales bacterium]|jgi:regulator of protease activity HflC (stomatin/prohibitin superfamily)|nr:SPFH/Band 7/PHB domain protein [Chlorobiales bacterium]